LHAKFDYTDYPLIAGRSWSEVGGLMPSVSLSIPGESFDLNPVDNGQEIWLSGSQILHSRIGGTQDIEASLHVASGEMAAYDEVLGIGWGFSPLSVSAFVDASHTALFALEVLTPDVTYTAESGRVYPTSIAAVPVPATLWLIGAALPGLGFTLRRRAR
jgi:hypothetical protein